MGVRRAMDTVLELAHRGVRPIYTFGPLIHNPQAVDMLRARGVDVAEDLSTVTGGTVVIRSHGISPEQRRLIGTLGVQVRDATCPRVAKVQAIIKRHAADGWSCIIVGDRDHPEVCGLLGFAGEQGWVVSAPEEIDDLPHFDNVCVVAQTTQSRDSFKTVVDRIQARYENCVVYDTICDSTTRRQEEVRRLAGMVDAMVVVGGRNSANTARLAEISRATGTPTIQIETDEELDEAWLRQFKTVGITAGASTPNWMIDHVIDRVESTNGSGRTSPLRWFTWITKAFVRSHLYVALGAASLSYASCRLQGVEPNFTFHFIACFYVFGMHILNRFTDIEAARVKEPSRVWFYQKHKKPLIALGLFAGIGALVLAAPLGSFPFFMVLLATILGSIYRIPVIPAEWSGPLRLRSLKDIPASKDVFLALGWTMVTVVLPPLAVREWIFELNTLTAFIFVLVLVFMRSVLSDIRDIQSDTMLGRETLPIILGMDRTKGLLWLLGIVLMGVLVSSAWMGITPGLSYYLLIPVLYAGICLIVYNRIMVPRGVWMEMVVDFTFILAGGVAYLWYLMT
jgi:(E)-4-hydroxy-3-methyl-but-2-enyl pyrophosphate reductase